MVPILSLNNQRHKVGNKGNCMKNIRKKLEQQLKTAAKFSKRVDTAYELTRVRPRKLKTLSSKIWHLVQIWRYRRELKLFQQFKAADVDKGILYDGEIREYDPEVGIESLILKRRNKNLDAITNYDNDAIEPSWW